jgi:osmoprotectant transport system substrate-binding protein
VAEIYAGALNAAGIQATVTDATAEAGLAHAVSSGFADVAPGRTGSLLLGLDATSTATTADAVVQALRQALPEDLALLTPAAADSHSALVATAATAEQYDARNLSDLAPSCGKLTLGAPAGVRTSAQGLPGLEAGYDCVPGTFVALADDGGEAVQALIAGSVDVVELPATQPAIVDQGLVVLEDPKTVFAAQQVVPVVNAKVVGQDAVEVLNRVSAELGSDDLTDLDRAVAGDARLTPAEAASDWLKGNGFT